MQLRGLGAVAFTGSRDTGRRVAYAAAAGVGTASDDSHPLPPRLIMELGGKDAVYVRADVVSEHLGRGKGERGWHFHEAPPPPELPLNFP